jgi:hypothetical protein
LCKYNASDGCEVGIAVDAAAREIFYGGRTPTASRQASRHETKDAVLLHS